MARTHQYTPTIHWTGNRGTGTSSYRDYARTHEIAGAGKPTIPGSADRAFRGDRDHWNPEELLVVSLAQCHMLWYLHLAADAGVVVTEYVDEPLGTMAEQPDGGGQFTEVLLRPAVTVVEPSMVQRANALHDDAHAMCFIARSVNFPVGHAPTTQTASAGTSPPGEAT